MHLEPADVFAAGLALAIAVDRAAVIDWGLGPRVQPLVNFGMAIREHKAAGAVVVGSGNVGEFIADHRDRAAKAVFDTVIAFVDNDPDVGSGDKVGELFVIAIANTGVFGPWNEIAADPAVHGGGADAR